MEESLFLDDGFNEKKLDNNTDIAEANRVRRDINESIQGINRGKYAVFAIIGFLLFGTIVEIATEPDLMVASSTGFVFFAVLYGIGLYLMRKQPVAGLVFCLVVYILFIAITVFIEPSMLYKGFIVKGLLLYFLGSAIQQARKLPQKINELKGISLTYEDMEKIKKKQELPKIHYVKPNPVP